MKEYRLAEITGITDARIASRILMVVRVPFKVSPADNNKWIFDVYLDTEEQFLYISRTFTSQMWVK
jgi:hypothetical protein